MIRYWNLAEVMHPYPHLNILISYFSIRMSHGVMSSLILALSYLRITLSCLLELEIRSTCVVLKSQEAEKELIFSQMHGIPYDST